MDARYIIDIRRDVFIPQAQGFVYVCQWIRLAEA